MENRGICWRGQNTAHQQGLPGTGEGLPDEGGKRQFQRGISKVLLSEGGSQAYHGERGQPLGWADAGRASTADVLGNPAVRRSGRAQNQKSSSNASISFQR